MTCEQLPQVLTINVILHSCIVLLCNVYSSFDWLSNETYAYAAYDTRTLFFWNVRTYHTRILFCARVGIEPSMIELWSDRVDRYCTKWKRKSKVAFRENTHRVTNNNFTRTKYVSNTVTVLQSQPVTNLFGKSLDAKQDHRRVRVSNATRQILHKAARVLIICFRCTRSNQRNKYKMQCPVT